MIEPFGEDAFAAGVDRTAEATTAAVNLQVTAEGLAIDAAGDFDYRARRGRLEYDFSRTPGSESLTGVDTVYSRGQVYMRLGAGERPWIHADLASAHEDLRNFTEAAGLEAPPPSWPRSPPSTSPTARGRSPSCAGRPPSRRSGRRRSSTCRRGGTGAGSRPRGACRSWATCWTGYWSSN